MQEPKYITGIQHIGLPTNDMEATAAFYEGMGFTIALETINEAAGEKVVFLQLGNLMLEVYENHCVAWKIGAIDHIALNVLDIETAWKVAHEKKYQLIDEEIQFLPFWENGVRFFTVIGPNKEKIEFSQKL